MVMDRVPLMAVARNLGHADTRMVEKHYGHLAPSYVADTVRAAFGMLGLIEPRTWCHSAVRGILERLARDNADLLAHWRLGMTGTFA